MSEVRLNILDRKGAINGTAHGSSRTLLSPHCPPSPRRLQRVTGLTHNNTAATDRRVRVSTRSAIRRLATTSTPSAILRAGALSFCACNWWTLLQGPA